MKEKDERHEKSSINVRADHRTLLVFCFVFLASFTLFFNYLCVHVLVLSSHHGEAKVGASHETRRMPVSECYKEIMAVNKQTKKSHDTWNTAASWM
jgi:hypothetical protein